MHESLEVEHEQQEPHVAPSGNTPLIYLRQIYVCVIMCVKLMYSNVSQTMF